LEEQAVIGASEEAGHAASPSVELDSCEEEVGSSSQQMYVGVASTRLIFTRKSV
jgi:hypothetical protein